MFLYFPNVNRLRFQHLMCAGLWCLVEGDTSCKTKLDPPLDGTECGADKVTNYDYECQGMLKHGPQNTPRPQRVNIKEIIPLI